MTSPRRNHVAIIARAAPTTMVPRTVNLTASAAALLDHLTRGDQAVVDQLISDLLEDHVFSAVRRSS